MLDGDEAGRKATEKYALQLREINTGVKVTAVELPEGEDVNSILLSHEREIVGHLLDERKTVFNSSSVGLQVEKPVITPPGLEPSGGALNTSNPDRISFPDKKSGQVTHPIHIEVWGGVPLNNLHQLKLSLSLKNTENHKTFRDEVNLYSHRSSKQFLQDAVKSWTAHQPP